MATNYKAVAALICGLAVFFAMAQAQKKLPPDYEKKREAIRNFEAGAVPLFVLGDLNEDGAVDQEDLKLLRAYIAHKASGGVSCLAAADLDDNGSVNGKDVAVLEQVLSKGAVQAVPLSAHSRLGCDFRNFFIAARPQAKAGGDVPIHFLDASFNPQNSSVVLSAGPATVAQVKGVYVVHVAPSASSGAIVSVAITLPNQRKYYYSFRVTPLE
jgi:hypothetical protein